MAQKKPKPPKHPWQRIERDSREDLLSHADICRKYGLNEAYLRRKARTGKWKKDLKEQTRSRALVVLRNLESDQDRVRNEKAQAEGKDSSTATDEEIIDDAVRTQLGVILTHRKDFREARELVTDMLSELRGQTHNQAAILDMIDRVYATANPTDMEFRQAARRLLSLANRATTMVNLANALGKVTGLERQVFGLEEKATKDPVKVDAEKVVRTDGRTDLERAAAVLNMVERASRAKATHPAPETEQ